MSQASSYSTPSSVGAVTVGPVAPPPAPSPAPAGEDWHAVVTVLLLVALGVLAFFGYVLVKRSWESSSPNSVRHVATTGSTTVVFPPRAAGLTRVDAGTDKRLDALVKEYSRGVPRGQEASSAGYAGNGQAAFVWASAFDMDQAKQDSEVKDFVRMLGEQHVKVTAAEPGPLGGRMLCGSVEAGSPAVVICGYVDRGGEGFVIVTGPAAKARSTVLALRAAVERPLA